MKNINLTGQLLIAMPAMTDPTFSKTVTFICTHNADGAMGIVLNRESDISLENLFTQIKLDTKQLNFGHQMVQYGGPMQTDRGFILHIPLANNVEQYNSSLMVNDCVALTTSKDILEAVKQNNGPQKMLIALGYAGWTPNQLEQEIAQNAWLTVEVTQIESLYTLIFDCENTQKYDYAMRFMGLNIANLAHVAGHA